MSSITDPPTYAKGVKGNGTGYFMLTMACSFWGIAFISSQVCLQWFDAYALTQYRFLVATVCMFVLVIVQKDPLKVKPRDLARIGLCGLFGITVYYVFNNLSIKYSSGSIAAIIGSSIPLFAATIEVFIKRTPPGLVTVCSVMLSVAGVILLAGFQAGTNNLNLALGIAFALLASFSFALYSFLLSPLQDKYPASTITFYQSLLAVTFCIVFLPQNSVPWGEVGFIGWGNLIFLGVFCSAGCYMLYNYAVCRLPVVVCTLFINAIPIVAIVTSFIVYDERLSALQLLGTTMVLGSVIWMSLSSSRSRRES